MGLLSVPLQIARAASLAGVNVVDVDAHALAHQGRFRNNSGWIFATLLRKRAEQLGSGNDSALAIDTKGDTAVVGIF
jgi:hypothetical protein